MADEEKKDERKNQMNDETEEKESSELEELKAKCAEYENGWKRALADYDNLKKDLARQRGEMRQQAAQDIAEEFIPVLDNFDQAVKFQPNGLDEKAKNWISGILHVRSQLEEILKRLGVEPFGSEGDPFDPHLHESIGEKSEENKKDGIILEVHQRGWKIGQKIIRPAKVIVNNLKTKR